jgi:hypothetical protein
MPQKASVVKLAQQIEAQPHELGQDVFKRRTLNPHTTKSALCGPPALNQKEDPRVERINT